MAAAIIPMFLPRACRACGMACDSAGHHCQACLDKLPPLPLSFVQSTAASIIRDLEKVSPSDPIRTALFQIRQLFDAITPRVLAPQIGVVRFDGEFWAYPEDSSECIGPFSTAELAAGELIRRIAQAPHVAE